MVELEAHHWIFGAELDARPVEEELELALDALLAAVEMEGVTRMVSVRGQDWDAVQIIAESHIILHGKGLAACADVFSCKAFDVGVARAVLTGALGGEWWARHVKRGR